MIPITEIFCDIDNFCKDFFTENLHLLSNPNRKRNRKYVLTESEVMTITVLFHMSGHRTFKHFYKYCVITELRKEFPNLVSYNRFVELQQNVSTLFLAYLASKKRNETGLYYVDSTSLKVCNNRRIHRHKTFKDIAKRGKTSMGWFFGFKLHLVINHIGEIVSFMITNGNVDDRKPLKKLFKNLKGLAGADKGYIGKKYVQDLSKQGLRFITKVKRNMKKKYNATLSRFEKYFLSMRSLVETVIGQLKYSCQIEHSRHRSTTNFVTNLLSGLVAYSFKPEKIKLNLRKLPEGMFEKIA